MEGKPFKEAQISRATTNRATAVIAEWNAYIAEHGRRTPGEARRDTDVAALKKKLKVKAAECADLRQRLDAAATVIAALHHDNQALREHNTSREGTIADLDERRARNAPVIGPC